MQFYSTCLSLQTTNFQSSSKTKICFRPFERRETTQLSDSGRMASFLSGIANSRIGRVTMSIFISLLRARNSFRSRDRAVKTTSSFTSWGKRLWNRARYADARHTKNVHTIVHGSEIHARHRRERVTFPPPDRTSYVCMTDHSIVS